MAEFVADNGTRVADQRLDNVFLQLQSQVKIAPSLVPVFQCRHAEDEVMYIFDITLRTPFVTQTENHAMDLEEA